ncbi:alpha-xenorhabdolysin family binary toxin subunit B [Pseudomonas abietaniphila]|uniref:alpha-xenorhabdolysin family binary toxin subunit B n=1 Tax=Pseudomonas abietaniphila TaxID=89065 RepID=UPI0007848A07|nr:alpha-xenorhabdolysin family binary toxin subunit B [Pseudomonas abietaniphila]
MSNITYLNNNDVFKPVDIKALRNNIRVAGLANSHVQSLSLSTDYLPSLAAKISFSYRYLTSVETALRDTASAMPVILNSGMAALKNLQLERKTATESDLEEIAEDINGAVVEVSGKITQQANNVRKALADISEELDRFTTDTEIEVFKQNNKLVSQELETTESATAQLSTERSAVTSAIALIETKDFATLLNDTILTAKTLADAGMQPPQVEIVEAGLKIGSEFIGDVQKGLKLLDLIDLRNSMNERLDKLTGQLKAFEDQLAKNNDSIKLILQAYAFDDLRGQVVIETNQLIDTIKAVTVYISQTDTGQEDQLSDVVQTLQKLSDYIRTIT